MTPVAADGPLSASLDVGAVVETVLMRVIERLGLTARPGREAEFQWEGQRETFSVTVTVSHPEEEKRVLTFDADELDELMMSVAFKRLVGLGLSPPEHGRAVVAWRQGSGAYSAEVTFMALGGGGPPS